MENCEGQSHPPCLYCGETDFEVSISGVEDRLGYVPGKCDWLRCRHCGSLMLSPFPSREELPGFYPPVYTFRLDRVKEGRLRRLISFLEYHTFYRLQYQSQSRRVLKMTKLTGRSPRLLDVGCGHGLRLVSFRQQGADVHGMDFVPEPVEYVKNELGIPAVCTDIDGLPEAFPQASFDLVTAFHVLEHVPDVEELMTVCRAMLKPGGWLAIAVPLADSTQAAVFGSRWCAISEAPRHLSLPSRTAIKAALERCGFKDVISSYDSAVNSAGFIGLSAFPGAASTHFLGQQRLKGLVSRTCGAAAALCSLPWCWLENVVWRRPSIGLYLGQTPES